MGFQDRSYLRTSSHGGYAGSFKAWWSSYSVVKLLIIINVAIYLVDLVFTHWMRMEAWTPLYLGEFTLEQAVNRLQLWRWITYQFLHANPPHLLFNMIALYFFGRLMEQWWGSARFLAFYLLCGISGAVLFTILAYTKALPIAPTTGMVGASGAIFGILIGCALVAPDMKVMLIIPPIPMKMRTLAWIVLGIAAFMVVTRGQNAGGEAAHLGGAALGFVLVKNPRLLNFVGRLSMPRMPQRDESSRWEAKQRERDAKRAEVDRILAKVKEQGLQSLTRKEKKILQDATDEQRRAS